MRRGDFCTVNFWLHPNPEWPKRFAQLRVFAFAFFSDSALNKKKDVLPPLHSSCSSGSTMSQRPKTRASNQDKHPGLVIAKATRRSSAEVAAEKAQKDAELKKKKMEMSENIKKLAQMEALQENKDMQDKASAAHPPTQRIMQKLASAKVAPKAKTAAGRNLFFHKGH
jgi:hypothetical protein